MRTRRTATTTLLQRLLADSSSTFGSERSFSLDEPAPHTLYAGRLEGIPVLITEPSAAGARMAVHADRIHLAAIDRWFASHR